jgi:hypothetical protein
MSTFSLFTNFLYRERGDVVVQGRAVPLLVPAGFVPFWLVAVDVVPVSDEEPVFAPPLVEVLAEPVDPVPEFPVVDVLGEVVLVGEVLVVPVELLVPVEVPDPVELLAVGSQGMSLPVVCGVVV